MKRESCSDYYHSRDTVLGNLIVGCFTTSDSSLMLHAGRSWRPSTVAGGKWGGERGGREREGRSGAE